MNDIIFHQIEAAVVAPKSVPPPVAVFAAVHPRLAKLAPRVESNEEYHFFFLKNPKFGFGFGFGGAAASAAIHSCSTAASHII